VRPASYRLLWKDTGTCTPGAASPVMSVCGPSPTLVMLRHQA
jgi:hypothetical protein